MKSNNFAAERSRLKFLGPGTAFWCISAYFNPWTHLLSWLGVRDDSIFGAFY